MFEKYTVVIVIKSTAWMSGKQGELGRHIWMREDRSFSKDSSHAAHSPTNQVED